MAERYCVPSSAPWRLSVGGSWMVKKISSSSLNEITAGSKVTWTTSACPVVPEQTSRYDGFAPFQPVSPETTRSTPYRSTKTASSHQKQPPANIATSCAISLSLGGRAGGGRAGAGGARGRAY